MGRILEYVILLSNLSLLIAVQQSENVTTSEYEREVQDNFTIALRQYLPKDQNEVFSKRALHMPLGPPVRRRTPPRPKQMSKTPGLNAYAVKDFPPRNRKRNFGTERRKPPFPPLNHNVTYGKNLWNFRPPPQKERTPRLPPTFKQNNFTDNAAEDTQRRLYKDWRNARFNSGIRSPKVCDPCNSVPWVPIFKPNSYRQQRTHVTELHKVPSHEIGLDFNGFASDTQTVTLPQTPLVPPLEPIHDGTISSSFGLPVGNIPTGHGLLAPLNHLTTKYNHYGSGGIDFSNSLQLFPTQTVLESNPIPELSPVPVVPLHDSGQFYQVDTSVSDLVPPLQPTKPTDVSNVVLTISEDNHGKLNPDSIKLQAVNDKDLNSASTSQVNYSNDEQYPPLQNLHSDLGKLEIVKSIPLIEFTSTVTTYPQSGLQVHPPVPTQVNYLSTGLQPPSSAPAINFAVPPSVFSSQLNYQPGFHAQSVIPTQVTYAHTELQPPSPFPTQINFAQPPSPVPTHITYPQKKLQVPSALPPLQFHLAGVPPTPLYKTEYRAQKDVSNSEGVQNFNFLVPPPPVKKAETDTNLDKSKNGVLPFLNPPKKSDVEPVKSSTVPRPLTSSSVSWLFSDSSTPSTSPKTPEQFALGSQEIASIVNNELRPVSPYPTSTPATSSEASTNKKIQIIIPYMTKNKNGYDNNALESVHREVFQQLQPPVNNSSRDSASSGPLPSRLHHHLPENKKVIDANSNHLNNLETDKYLNEMHHIIATNIRELLREEIEKSQKDQNYPLQNNIDNWTALEYSNHKTVAPKAPKEIINQAQAVTSIPGTSISHLLLPSKKIPKEYFVTTPIPVFDEPNATTFNATNSSVDSRPFTAKPYATTNFYHPNRNYRPTTLAANWAKANENLVFAESSTRKVSWNNEFKNSKDVEVVTPVNSYYKKQNYTSYSHRRTTRGIPYAEKTTPKTPVKSNSALAGTKLIKVNTTSVVNSTSKLKTYTEVRKTPEVKNLVTSENPKVVDTTENIKNSSKSEKETRRTEVVSITKNQTLPVNVTSEQVLSKTNESLSDLNSINDVFPFRNKELPWESKKNVSDGTAQNGRQRKSLIKQTKAVKVKTGSST